MMEKKHKHVDENKLLNAAGGINLGMKQMCGTCAQNCKNRLLASSYLFVFLSFRTHEQSCF